MLVRNFRDGQKPRAAASGQNNSFHSKCLRIHAHMLFFLRVYLHLVKKIYRYDEPVQKPGTPATEYPVKNILQRKKSPVASRGCYVKSVLLKIRLQNRKCKVGDVRRKQGLPVLTQHARGNTIKARRGKRKDYTRLQLGAGHPQKFHGPAKMLNHVPCGDNRNSAVGHCGKMFKSSPRDS